LFLRKMEEQKINVKDFGFGPDEEQEACCI